MITTPIISNLSSQRTLIKLKGSPKITISSDLQHQINYLHEDHSDLEWSGHLFWSYYGDINKPDAFEIDALKLYPGDYGDIASTEFETADIIDEMLKYYPDVMEYDNMLYGLIHSHHNMKSYFSTVDEAELKNNVHNYNMFLSLVVSVDGIYTARICFLGKETTTSTIIDPITSIENITTQDKEIVYYHECEVISYIPNIEVDSIFKDKCDELKAKKKTVYPTNFGYNNYYTPTSNITPHAQSYLNFYSMNISNKYRLTNFYFELFDIESESYQMLSKYILLNELYSDIEASALKFANYKNEVLDSKIDSIITKSLIKVFTTNFKNIYCKYFKIKDRIIIDTHHERSFKIYILDDLYSQIYIGYSDNSISYKIKTILKLKIMQKLELYQNLLFKETKTNYKSTKEKINEKWKTLIQNI